MVGQGVLHECLADSDVDLVVTVGRTRIADPGPYCQSAKFQQILHPDLSNLAPILEELAGFDACFFTLGVSSSGMKVPDYERLTYGFTLAAAEPSAELTRE